MKSTIIPIDEMGSKAIMILTAFLMFTLTSQGQEGRQQNNWIMDYTATVNGATENGKAHFLAMDTNAKQQVASFYGGRRFTFLDNGTYQMASTGMPQRVDSWALDNGTLTLLDVGNGQKLVYSISLTNTHLILRLEGTEADNALFRNLYLIPSS
ncbi:MAG: hypothetical protein AB3N18_00585 [Allomuricauda sp.]